MCLPLQILFHCCLHVFTTSSNTEQGTEGACCQQFGPQVQRIAITSVRDPGPDGFACVCVCVCVCVCDGNSASHGVITFLFTWNVCECIFLSKDHCKICSSLLFSTEAPGHTSSISYFSLFLKLQPQYLTARLSAPPPLLSLESSLYNSHCFLRRKCFFQSSGRMWCRMPSQFPVWLTAVSPRCSTAEARVHTPPGGAEKQTKVEGPSECSLHHVLHFWKIVMTFFCFCRPEICQKVSYRMWDDEQLQLPGSRFEPNTYQQLHWFLSHVQNLQ